MAEVKVIAVPELHASYAKLVDVLKSQDFETLLVNQPTSLEPHLSEMILDRLTYSDFIERVREERLIPEPVDGWRYHVEPLLKALPRLKKKNPDLEIHCYVDPCYNRSVVEKASKIACLTLSSIIKGKVDVREWKGAIEGLLDKWPVEMERVVKAVEKAAKGLTACVADHDGSRLASLLRAKGHRVTRKVIEVLYQPKPLEALQKLLEKSTPTRDDEVEALVKEHIRYVRDYVMRFRTRDQAYWRWAFDNFSNVREKYTLSEIEVLGYLAIENL